MTWAFLSQSSASVCSARGDTSAPAEVLAPTCASWTHPTPAQARTKLQAAGLAPRLGHLRRTQSAHGGKALDLPMGGGGWGLQALPTAQVQGGLLQPPSLGVLRPGLSVTSAGALSVQGAAGKSWRSPGELGAQRGQVTASATQQARGHNGASLQLFRVLDSAQGACSLVVTGARAPWAPPVPTPSPAPAPPGPSADRTARRPLCSVRPALRAWPALPVSEGAQGLPPGPWAPAPACSSRGPCTSGARGWLP